MAPKIELEHRHIGPCPECGIIRTLWEQLEYGKTVRTIAPVYQRSYMGTPEYISPRCSQCYDKTIEKGEEDEKP